MYEYLTDYIPKLEAQYYGKVVDDGISEPNVISDSVIEYSSIANEFFDAIYKFPDKNNDFQISNYLELAKQAKHHEDGNPVIEKLNALETYAFMLLPLRAARFGNAKLPLTRLKDGYYINLLKHLKSLDT